MNEISMDMALLDDAINWLAPAMARESRRHPLWVKRRMREEVDAIVAGQRPMGQLWMVVLGVAMELGKRGYGNYAEERVETAVVLPFPTPPEQS